MHAPGLENALCMLIGAVLATPPVFFAARLTVKSEHVLTPIQQKMERRKRYINEMADYQPNDHEREECPLADDDGEVAQ